MKRLIGLVIVALVLLAACGSNNDKKVTIGVASNDTKAWEKVKELAKKDDIDVEIKHFSDYNLPNKALNDGDIDMNAFQHFAFLDQYKKAHKGTKISALSTTVLAPLGIYSDKIKDVKKVKDGAKVVIPNDVSNQARALKLLEAAGLIKLKKDFGLAGTVKDITSNPKNDPIFLEKSDSDAVKPYINIVAVNDKDLDNKTYAKIVELYHSKEAQKALQEDVKDGEKPVNLSKDEIKAIETSLAK